jgi:hypothetical protein
MPPQMGYAAHPAYAMGLMQGAPYPFMAPDAMVDMMGNPILPMGWCFLFFVAVHCFHSLAYFPPLPTQSSNFHTSEKNGTESGKR